jgi:hypothetical protein
MQRHARTRRAFWLRWWVHLTLALLLSITLSVGTTAVLCKRYWGYVLSPPGVDPRVLRATKVVAYSWVGGDETTHQYAPASEEDEQRWWPRSLMNLSSFASIRNTDGAWRLVPNPVDAAAWDRDWDSRGVVPRIGAPPKVAPERIATLRSLIESTAAPVSGAYGNGLGSARSFAQLFQLLGPSGEPLFFVSLHTGTLSNDHLAYYELLYDDSTNPPTLLDRRQWSFDVAGMEGAEFLAVSVLLFVPAFLLLVPTTAGVLAYRRLSKGARVRRGHCPRCNYDLRRVFDQGCSECGWGRGEERAGERDLRRYSLWGRLIGVATRAPGWRSLVVVAIAAALLWYGLSMPGQVPWAVGWGRRLLALGLALGVVKATGVWLRPAWCPPNGSTLGRPARFAAATVLLACCFAALETEWPIHARFSLSRAALERSALDARAKGFPNRAPVGANMVAGLYKIGGILPAGGDSDGYIVWVGDAGGSPMRGFAWYPGPRPARATAYGSLIELWEEVAPGWYLWDYVRSTR